MASTHALNATSGKEGQALGDIVELGSSPIEALLNTAPEKIVLTHRSVQLVQ